MKKLQVRVEGLLDSHWSEWLEDLEIIHEDEDHTLMKGLVEDQATIYGILTKLRNLGLNLVLVEVTDEAEKSTGEVS